MQGSAFTAPSRSLRTSCDSPCRARSDYCLAMAKEASRDRQPRRPQLVLCERLSRTLRYDCSARNAAQPAGVLSLANSGSPLVRLLWSCFCLRRSQPARDCSATARRESGRCGASSCAGRLSVGRGPWARVSPQTHSATGRTRGDNLVADRLSSTSVIPRFPASLFSARRRRGRRNVRPAAEPTARSGVRSHGG